MTQTQTFNVLSDTRDCSHLESLPQFSERHRGLLCDKSLLNLVAAVYTLGVSPWYLEEARGGAQMILKSRRWARGNSELGVISTMERASVTPVSRCCCDAVQKIHLYPHIENTQFLVDCKPRCLVTRKELLCTPSIQSDPELWKDSYSGAELSGQTVQTFNFCTFSSCMSTVSFSAEGRCADANVCNHGLHHQETDLSPFLCDVLSLNVFTRWKIT